MRRPNITDQVVISGGRAVTNRQPTWPTARGTARGLEREPADGAVDPVGADNEIVIAARSVAALDGDDAVALRHAVHGLPEADLHVAGRLEQQSVELGSMNRQAWPDGAPELRDVDLAQQPAAVIAEALARYLDGTARNLRVEAERAQGARGVPGQIHAGTGGPPRGLALDHLGRGTDAREHARERQAGDPATYDQYAPFVHGLTPAVDRVQR